MNRALIVVDAQADYLAVPDLQPSSPLLIERIAAALEACRGDGFTVIHVWTTVRREHDTRLPHWRAANRWWCVDGTAGHNPPPILQPLEQEAVIHKSGFNGFASGELWDLLVARGCDSVAIVGLHLHTCVRAIAVESLERNLRVHIVDDAVGTDDPVLAAATRRWLAARCVSFISVADVTAREGIPAVSGLVHRSPHRVDTVLFDVQNSGPNRIAEATSAARSAWRDWRRTRVDVRAAILEPVADRLEAAAADLSRQMAVDIGKPISHGREEVLRSAASIRDVMRRAREVSEDSRQPAGTVRNRPVGVVAMISPWNNPVAIAVGKIAPAVVYGNAVVWKPAPAATRVSEAVMAILSASGLPASLVQMLSGDHTTALTLAADRHIDAVTLTGSAAAGHAVQEVCARRFVPLQAELSGNNAAIVWDDANLEDAARQIAWGAFGFAGQRCTANRRVIVSRDRSEQLLDELHRAAARLVWGDPLDPATDIGPVIHTTKREEHARLVSQAGRVIRPFAHIAREPWVRSGAYAEPVIVVCDDAGDAIVQEETMSPLLVVQRADDFEHALRLCNGVRHGLVAALFSESPELQEAFLADAQAGMLKLNAATAGVDVTLPFGGWKESGLGPPEHGEGDRLFYTRLQAVYGASEHER